MPLLLAIFIALLILIPVLLFAPTGRIYALAVLAIVACLAGWLFFWSTWRASNYDMLIYALQGPLMFVPVLFFVILILAKGARLLQR